MNVDQCSSEVEPGLRCSRDAGHDGPHFIEGEVPPVIGQMIEGVAREMEEARDKHLAAARRANRAALASSASFLLFLGAFIVTALDSIGIRP